MRIFFYIILLSLFSFIVEAQTERQRAIDSLKLELEKIKEDTLISQTLIRLASRHLNIDAKKALEYAKKAVVVSKRGDHFRLAAAYNTVANIYQKLSKYDLSFENYNNSLDVIAVSEDTYLLADVYNNIGNLHDAKGEFGVAVEYYIKSLKINEKKNDRKGMSVTYNNIGLSYYRQELYEEALKYYDKSLEIRIELNDKEGEALAYNNIGIIYYELGKTELVLDYFKKSLKIYEDFGDIRQQSLPLYNIGQIYYENGDYDNAIIYFKKSLDIDLELGDLNSVSMTYDFIGRLYLEIGMTDLALKYQHEGLKIADEIGSILNVKDSYEGLSITYDSLGNYKKALKYHQLYKHFTDSIFNIDKHSQFVDMQTKYETEKKEQEIKITNLALDKQVAENERQSILIYTFIIGFIIILVFSIMIFRMFVQKKKANIKLENMNAEILQQKEEIQAQSEQLLEINKELEKLSIVASETDNSVIIADSAGDIEWVNDAFVRTTGYTKNEFMDIFGGNILTASKNPKIEAIVNNCVEKKKSVEYVSLLEKKSGDQVWFQTTLTPILDSNANIKKLVAIDSNITELKNAEEKIRNQKKEITDSIQYALRIQTAIMPPEYYLKMHLPEFFLLFMPKDVISGDFYWAKQHNENLIFCVSDCTGHGVPGAFMSMLGIALLNEIVNNSVDKALKASDILNSLRENLIESLHQTGIDNEAKDGMDMSICILEKDKKTLQFAGANNPLYIVKSEKLKVESEEFSNPNIIANEMKQSAKKLDSLSTLQFYEHDKLYELHEVKGNKMPIGIHLGKVNPFTNNEIKLDKGDVLYLFSDGFPDQFGGKKGKKFKYKPFKKLILESSYLELDEQKNILSKILNSWMNHINLDTNAKFEQIDDICVLGVKV